ncbi:MAG: protein-L-isoaspartate(D-aspartate) O-methyltransferase [Anaerolineales bacterium]|nr:protein-L-isoaspartate(D-aspartate) O-methyltransferase [Anaerolineales bacterium]
MSSPDTDFTLLRERMVNDQLTGRDITDERVLEAMRCVPRHLFVPQDMEHMAYWDGPLSIGEGQTISQPYIVALMTQLLELKGDDKVLEVGCGSGYQAAVLSCLVDQVFSIERFSSLADRASRRLYDLNYLNVSVHLGDGTLGMPSEAPFDAILITAASPDIPLPLKEQLATGGRLVAPIGSLGSQVIKILKKKQKGFETDHSIPVMFVPLIGKYGWNEKDWDRGRWFG